MFWFAVKMCWGKIEPLEMHSEETRATSCTLWSTTTKSFPHLIEVLDQWLAQQYIMHIMPYETVCYLLTIWHSWAWPTHVHMYHKKLLNNIACVIEIVPPCSAMCDLCIVRSTDWKSAACWSISPHSGEFPHWMVSRLHTWCQISTENTCIVCMVFSFVYK